MAAVAKAYVISVTRKAPPKFCWKKFVITTYVANGVMPEANAIARDGLRIPKA